MEQDPDSPPTFWFQPPRATNRRRAPPIDPVVLIILIPILALIFLFFLLPPFLSYTSDILSHISKPGSVKSTWDSLNIFLVLFAILCGVLARQNDDAPSSSTDVSNGFVTEGISSSSGGGQSSGQWTGFSDRKAVPGGLRRNSSSYPNLRNESVWESENRNQNRFFDDFNLYSLPANRYYNNLSQRTENLYRPVELYGDIHRRSRRSEADRVEFSDEKEIFVDTFEVTSNTPEFQQPPVTPPPPPPPPPPRRSASAANSKRHSFRSVAKNVTVEAPPESESDVFEETRSYTPPPPPPPPPPPSTEVKVHRSRNKHKKLERKVSDATKEIATAISSLYNQRKRKSKRKLRDNSGSSDTSPPSIHPVLSETEQISQQTPAPPPPPPPPPPPYRFQNLFKKGGKHKRIHSVPVTVSGRVPPPPPPPPPPSSIFNNILKSVSKSKRFHSHSNSHSHSTAPPPPPPPPSSNTNRVSKTESKSKRFNSIFSPPPAPPPLPPPMTPPRYTVKSKQISSNRRNDSKPPLPTKANTYYDREEFLPSGSQSPLIPMPPPPPPFKMKAMKFELRGDFVRIQSTHSSVCSSPDRDVDFSSLGMDGGDSIGPGSGLGLGSGPRFHPSPDVNAKAEKFISRLKNEWRMEKKNYGKEKMG